MVPRTPALKPPLSTSIAHSPPFQSRRNPANGPKAQLQPPVVSKPASLSRSGNSSKSRAALLASYRKLTDFSDKSSKGCDLDGHGRGIEDFCGWYCRRGLLVPFYERMGPINYMTEFQGLQRCLHCLLIVHTGDLAQFPNSIDIKTKYNWERPLCALEEFYFP